MHRILVVDDEPVVRKGLAFIIEQCVPSWVAVAQAESAREALAMMRQTPYQLIVTDIRMPDIDGLVFIAEARRLEPEIRAIIISGFGEFEYARRAMQLGCLDFLRKPVKKEDLQQMTANILAIWTEESSRRKKQSETEELADHFRFHRLLNGEFDTLADMYECASMIELYPNVSSIAMLTLEVEGSASQLPLYLFAKEYFQDADAHVYREDNREVIVLLRGDGEDESAFQQMCLRQADNMIAAWTQLSRTPFFASLCLLSDVAEFPSCRRKAQEVREEKEERLTVHVFEAEHSAKRETADAAIRKAMRMIEEQFDQELSASGVAAAVHLSADYFSWLFHREVGKTYTEYLTEIRIEQAKRLLLDKDIPAYEIAERIGYQSVRNFNRVFKAWVGQTPIHFRKKNKANVPQDPNSCPVRP